MCMFVCALTWHSMRVGARESFSEIKLGMPVLCRVPLNTEPSCLPEKDANLQLIR